MLILVSECNVCNMESCKIEQINLCWELKDYRIYYVNMHLHHQYGINLSLSHRGSSEQNVPSDEEQGEMAVFAG